MGLFLLLALQDDILVELEKKSRAVRRYTAEFEVTAKESKAVASVWADSDARKGLLQFHAKDALQFSILIEGDEMRAWGPMAKEPTVVRFQDLLGTLDDRLGAALDELDRTLGVEPPKRTPSLGVVSLQIVLYGDDFRMAIGVGPRAHSWFREIKEAKNAERQDLTWTIPSPKKTIVLDEQGFLQSMTIEEAAITRRAYRDSVDWPKLDLPKKFRPMPIPPATVQQELDGHLSALLGAVKRVGTEWPRARERQEQVAPVFTRWASVIEDLLLTLMARDFSRAYVEHALRIGVSVSDLQKEVEDHLAKFLEAVGSERIEKELRGGIQSLQRRVELEMPQIVADEKVRAAIVELLKKAFRFEDVDAERKRNEPDRISKIFREEVKRASEF